MIHKNLIVGALMILSAGSVVAGRQTPEPITAALTPLQKLENAVRYDQFTIEHPALGTKPVIADVHREDAKMKLTRDQAALDAFKTAGPSAELTEAIAYDRWEAATGGFESKPVQRWARMKAAQENLARHEAALSALK